MISNQNQSYSLLNQDEIDVLVSFLLDKKNSVDSDVMSQQSIDKLIYLITHDRKQLINMLDPIACVDSTLLIQKQLRQKEEEVCELRYSITDNGYLTLTAFNPTTGQTMEITPELFSDTDTVDWGKCISPLTLNRIARSLSLKYTIQTHEQICHIFASTIYGDEAHAIPALHLPTNTALLDTIL